MESEAARSEEATIIKARITKNEARLNDPNLNPILANLIRSKISNDTRRLEELPKRTPTGPLS